ncbi:MAG: M20/M25/M40 family metallo-hydrolase, partial [Thermoanaerobaculia bacterium]
PHTGAMKVEAGTRTLPAAALSGPDADLLERLAGRGAVRVRYVLGCRTLPDQKAANIVGDLRGSKSPEEVVLLGAHLDSWDLGTGAIDDGAGIGIVIEAALRIAALPRRPARTLRVVLFANEENGERGALAYAKAHESEAAKYVAALEMDLGTDRVYKMSWLAGPEGSGSLGEIAGLLKPLGIAETASETDGGSDVGPLRAFGVPLIELNQDASHYFDIHHSADDTFDKIDAANFAQAAAATAVVAYVAADMPGTFGRVPFEKRKIPQW